MRFADLLVADGIVAVEVVDLLVADSIVAVEVVEVVEEKIDSVAWN
jgi:hypothetical protein